MNKLAPVSFGKIIFVFLLLETFILWLGWWQHGVTLLALQTITRYSGRLSLLLFSFIFLSYSKPQVLSAWLSKQYYLLFAIVHGIHLLELLFYITLSDSPIIPIRLAGGALAYLFIFVLPILHKYHTTGRITANQFKVIEAIYVYYLWFIFFMTYLPRVQGKLPQVGGSYAEYVMLLGWVSLLLGLKVSSVLFVSNSKGNNKS